MNTLVETKFRLLVLLSVLPDGDYTQQWISAMDFISIYSATFNVGDHNLHGDRWMRFTEYATKFWNLHDALHELVLNGWASAKPTKNGYTYRITDIGRAIAGEFTTSYVAPFRKSVSNCYEHYGYLSGSDLDAMIRKAALTSLEQEGKNG